MRLSVDQGNAYADGPLDGKRPQELDEAFIKKFNEDWRWRYEFYRDEPGHFDLVARSDGQTLVIEGKGQSSGNRRGAVAQIVGSLTLDRLADRPAYRYGILIPDGEAWNKALRNHGGLDCLEVYRIGSASGDIVEETWESYRP